ncbi:MAG: WxcM domain-containing protein domain-containing protein [Candidatus Pacebacteria bacterium GW2011_GWB1_47_8]|nr:MAG: WxcM domain-containing protein domain-containing protein [Candidatus Pacebacteria bacterium GW2011_GWA1_46_10]KKU84423.1 MAG: WxcM domain-containing protein domain-containing protein [Candidatus Pacebacteria bacterium GW2011_GWB1_47_8]HCR81145.1 dTDP-6-deoxy-3,4-keto-hexulose isomerase [Candidatus Paceibacterota bacterium]
MTKKKNGLFKTIIIPKITDDCFLYFAESPRHIPFPIRRIYYITKAKKDLPRGFHAHRKTQQVLFCIQGSIKIVFDNGHKRETMQLDDPKTGVFIDRMVWHEMHQFSRNAVLLVVASAPYNPKDYIRDYREFKKLV